MLNRGADPRAPRVGFCEDVAGQDGTAFRPPTDRIVVNVDAGCRTKWSLPMKRGIKRFAWLLVAIVVLGAGVLMAEFRLERHIDVAVAPITLPTDAIRPTPGRAPAPPSKTLYMPSSHR